MFIRNYLTVSDFYELLINFFLFPARPSDHVLIIHWGISLSISLPSRVVGFSSLSKSQDAQVHVMTDKIEYNASWCLLFQPMKMVLLFLKIEISENKNIPLIALWVTSLSPRSITMQLPSFKMHPIIH